MEAAIEASSKCQITDASMLSWRKKLKLSAQECGDALRDRECRQRVLADAEAKEQVRQCSLPGRVAHATKSLVSSSASGHTNDGAVQRFERLADSASDFLAFVQAGGGAPRQHLFFDPLIRHLFAGNTLQYKRLLQRGRQYQYFSVRPMSFDDRGLEAMLAFIHEDLEQPESSFRLGFMLRLSESMDVIGATVRCLQLVTPHFKSTAEAVIKELTMLPTQDFSCSAPYGNGNSSMNHWNSIHNTLTRWFRQDPLCCKGSDYCSSSSGADKASSTRLLSSIFPEPVSEVFLQRYVSPSEYRPKGAGGSASSIAADRTSSSSREDLFPYLKLGALFMPHDCAVVDDNLTKVWSNGVQTCAIEAIDGEKQRGTLVDVHPHQLDVMLLPKAIDNLYSNSGATTHQISWKSGHGSAYLCVEKMQMQRRTRGKAVKQRRRKLSRVDQMKKEKEHWKHVARDFIKLLDVRSADGLQGPFTQWLKYISRALK